MTRSTSKAKSRKAGDSNKLSPAMRYRKNKKQSKRPRFTIINPDTGAEFVVQLPELNRMIRAGIMPLHLVGLMETARKTGLTNNEAFDTLSTKDKIKTIEFGTNLVRDILVEPRIVDEIVDETVEITPDELEEDDFNFLLSWAMSGGEEQANPGLRDFRKEPQSASVDSVNS